MLASAEVGVLVATCTFEERAACVCSDPIQMQTNKEVSDCCSLMIFLNRRPAIPDDPLFVGEGPSDAENLQRCYPSEHEMGIPRLFPGDCRSLTFVGVDPEPFSM